MRLVIPLEEIKSWSDLTFKDLPSIEHTLHNLERGRYDVFTNQAKYNLNKAIETLNCAYQEKLISDEQRSKGENLIRNSLMTKRIEHEDREYILNILYSFEDFLDKRLNTVDEGIDYLFNSGWNKAEEIRIRSDSISQSITAFQNEKFANRQKLVKDYIFSSGAGKYITEIANEMSERLGEGFTVPNVKRIIDILENQEIITTWGGWGTGKRNKICYPNFRLIDRSLIDGKEQKLNGIIETRITHMFEPRQAKNFNWNIYEFNSNYEEPVYVVAGAFFKDGTELDSIGLFSHANLEIQMKKHLGYFLKDDYKSYSNKDSLVAYIINDIDGNLVWHNEKEQRALDLIGHHSELYLAA